MFGEVLREFSSGVAIVHLEKKHMSGGNLYLTPTRVSYAACCGDNSQHLNQTFKTVAHKPIK